MRIKRVGAFASIALVGSLLVSACGSSGSKTPQNLAFSQLPPCPLEALEKATHPVEITMWTDSVIESFKALQDLAASFNKSQSKVRVTVVRPFGDKTIPATLHAAFQEMNGITPFDPNEAKVEIPAGTVAPALVQFDSFRLRELADSGAILPAQSCINAAKFDASKILPAAKAYYSIGGVQWPAYMLPGMLMMEYNAQQFSKAGLDPAKPPKTLAELEEVARKLKASGVKAPISMPNDPNIIESWITGAGASLVSDGNGRDSSPQRATFYTEAAVDVLTRLARMMREGLILLIDKPDGDITHLLNLATGTSTITLETSASATSIAAVVEGNQQATEQAQQLDGGSGLGGTVTTDYRAAPFPGLKTAGQASMGGFAWYISRGVPPEQQAAAWEFAQWVYKPENQVAMLTNFGALPLTEQGAQASAAREWLGRNRLAPKWLKVASEQFKNADPALPGPLIGPYQQFQEILMGVVRQLPNPASPPPAQILTTAENDFTSQLAKYNVTHG